MSEHPAELTIPTPFQWRARFLSMSDADQVLAAERVLEAYAARDRCVANDHEAALELMVTHRCPSIEEQIKSRVDVAHEDGFEEGKMVGVLTGRQGVLDEMTAELDAREAERRAAHHDDDPQTEYADAAHGTPAT